MKDLGIKMDEIPNELAEVILNKKNSKFIDYNDFLVRGIFYNENIILHEKRHNVIRDGQEISYNIHAYRSPDFQKNVDFLFSGCSVTAGMGLSVDTLWHEMLMKKINGSYCSVATAGDSIPAQVLKIFAYIKEFGNPKNIVCLFPDFDRFLIYNNKKLLGSRMFFKSYSKKQYNWAISEGKDLRKLDYLYRIFKSSASLWNVDRETNYFKLPLLANDIITQEVSQMYSAQFINILSQYCEASGINFIWSSWDEKTDKLIKEIKNDLFFKEYVDVDSGKWYTDYKKNKDCFIENNVIVDCHSEFKNKENFDIASDTKDGISHAHYGFHRHIHFYEKFLKHIKGIS